MKSDYPRAGKPSIIKFDNHWASEPLDFYTEIETPWNQEAMECGMEAATEAGRDAGHGTEVLEVKPGRRFCLLSSVTRRKILSNGTGSRRTDGQVGR